MGWCADYPDAWNFLSGAINNNMGAYGGWSNPKYTALLEQAAQAQNPSERAALYQAAERILVETDAVMLPAVSLWLLQSLRNRTSNAHSR